MAEQQEGLWEHHILICENVRDADHPRPSCGPLGGPEIRQWFKEGIKRRNLNLTVRANKSGCLEGCEAGPTTVVYPDAVWYTVRNQGDVDRILDEHILGGEPVDDLRMDFTVLPAWQARKKRQR